MLLLASVRSGAWLRLFSQVQPVDYLFVTLAFRAAEVVKQAAALRDHFQEATPRRMILRVGLQVFRHLRDPFRQERDLYVGAPGVLLVQAELPEVHRFRVLCHKWSG
jgi:hypothetical protein